MPAAPTPSSSASPTLFMVTMLVLASWVQQTQLMVHAATMADVPIGDLVEAMVDSDMAEIVDDAEQVEVKINLQQQDGETYVSVEGRYDEDADVSPSSSVSAVSNGLLKYGVRGPQVVLLQDQLKALGYFSTSSTGYFGDITEAAVIQFQYANSLTVDGVAGPQTITTLQRVANSQAVMVTRSEPNYYAPNYTDGSATVQSAVTSSSPRRTLVQPVYETNTIATDPSPAQVVSYSATTATPRSNPPIAARNPVTSNEGAKVGTELYIGSQGQIVRDLQQLLRQLGKYPGPITGYFGPLTLEAVKDFQGAYGLSPTGIVGEKTLVTLNEAINQ